MRFDPERHHRRSIRLGGYDYRSAGVYFLTLCTANSESLLASVVDEVAHLDQAGELVGSAWSALPERFPAVRLDAWVIMPNHLHGILALEPSLDDSEVDLAGGASAAPALDRVVRAFKSTSAISVIRLLGRHGQPLWQRNYFERILRSEAELKRARNYIALNPRNWATDPENPGLVRSS